MGNKSIKSKVKCELNEYELEEYRMLTSLPEKEILTMQKKFKTYSGGDDYLTEEKFYEIPAISINPLKERLYQCFEKNKDGHITFLEFIKTMSVFTYHGSKDNKLQNSFKLHDFDNDGKINRLDLKKYIKLVTDFGELSEEEISINIEIIIQQTMEEASSDPNYGFLTFEDFVKVLTQTDFETKLLIQI